MDHKFFRKKEIPEDWEFRLIVPIFNSGGTAKTRGIPPLSTILKLFEKFIQKIESTLCNSNCFTIKKRTSCNIGQRVD